MNVFRAEIYDVGKNRDSPPWPKGRPPFLLLSPFSRIPVRSVSEKRKQNRREKFCRLREANPLKPLQSAFPAMLALQ